MYLETRSTTILLCLLKTKYLFSPGNIQTANEYLVKPFARGKAHSLPLQNPIKNVICSPE
jgi:hypothetical protein